MNALLRLLKATPEGEDSVALLQAAARQYIPIDPNNQASLAAAVSASQLPGSSLKPIPDPEHRQSIEDVIAEIQTQDWYADQIVYNTVFEPRSAQIGVCWSTHCPQTIRCIPVFVHSDLGSAAFGNYRASSSRLK